MEIRILDRDLNRLGELEDFKSLIWNRKYNNTGDFELYVIITKENIDMLKKGIVVYKKEEGVSEDECGYIEFRQLSTMPDGNQLMTVKGKFITNYLERRIIWGIENINTTYKNAIEHLVNVNCINTPNINRKIPLLDNIKNDWIDTQKINYQVSYKPLLDEIVELSLASQIGFKMVANVPEKKLKFITYKGIYRTDKQLINDKATFSLECGNMLTQQFTESINNYRNCTLIAGEGEDNNRKFESVGNQSNGLDRYETFTDARDLTSKYTVKEIKDGKEVDVEKTLTALEYKNVLESRGAQKLAETQEIQTFESNVNTATAGYKEIFDLGDVVTCVNANWGVKAYCRITEIQEIYEGNGFAINVTFGNSVPTLLDKINQKIKK